MADFFPLLSSPYHETCKNSCLFVCSPSNPVWLRFAKRLQMPTFVISAFKPFKIQTCFPREAKLRMCLPSYSLRAFFLEISCREHNFSHPLFTIATWVSLNSNAAASSYMVNKGLSWGLVPKWRNVQCLPRIGVNKHLRSYLSFPGADTGLPAPAQCTAQTSRDHRRSFVTKPTKCPSWWHLCLEPGATGNTVQRASASGGATATGGKRLAKKKFL